jgi:hypothetical protein
MAFRLSSIGVFGRASKQSKGVIDRLLGDIHTAGAARASGTSS